MGCGCQKVIHQQRASRTPLDTPVQATARALAGQGPMFWVLRCDDAGPVVFDDRVAAVAAATEAGCRLEATRTPPVGSYASV